MALDPTLFYVKDPQRFATYARIVDGRHPAPARAIRETFGARWVTVWKQPAYRRLAEQLAAAPSRALILYNTPDYLVFDLGEPASAQTSPR